VENTKSLDVLEDIAELRRVPEGEKFICLFSGGKDSGLALSIAIRKANPLALVNCCEQGRPLFHQHGKDILELQSQAINIPCRYVEGHWKESKELLKLCVEYKEKGAAFILFGDINDKKNALRKIELCHQVGLKPCMPLWARDHNEICALLAEHKIKSLITTTRPILYEELGKIFDEKLFFRLKKKGVNPLGEEGEFHSTLIDADIFVYPLLFEVRNSHILKDKFGEKKELMCKYYLGDEK